MRTGAVSIHAVAVALAAISVASSAGAVPILCSDGTGRVSVQTHCGHTNNRLRIEDLFDAAAPALVVSNDRNGRLSLDWHRLDLSNGWIFGTVFVPDARWAQPQLHGGAPNRNIPEPGTLVLLSIGLLGAALSRRYKRN
jgi:hypothetical protein